MYKKVSKVAAAIFTILILVGISSVYAQYGGGGGPSGFTIEASFITTGSGTNPVFDIDGIFGIDKIALLLTNDGGQFTLSVLEITKPSSIPDAPPIVVKYYRITIPSYINAIVAEGEISLSVSKDELIKLGVDPNSLVMYRFNEQSGKWEKLNTIKVDEDENNVYYKVNIEKLSFFALSGSKVVTIPVEPEVAFSKTFTIEGFDVPVTLTSGTVESIDVNMDEKSLEIMLDNVEKDAILTIDIPRGLLDARNPDGTDTNFSVIFDGEFADFSEVKEDEIRRLSISIPQFTEEINILGTFVVPEFGFLAILILATSITVIIIAMRNNGKKYILP
ncbi:MAG: hypothetical protein KatS3mg003_1915 [Candidatus Nitrosocaldaceae archaeon]|nr:MAG: hypothetical protein KatS3mg003_1915 [Candidatus Nitrosocaldaceae archaeon]